MSEKVTFQELIDLISEQSDYSKQFTHDFIKSLVSVINKGLEEDSKVNIAGFGKFELRPVKEREGYNPQTGEKITIPAHNKVVFKPYKKLREQVNAPYADMEPEVIEEESSSDSDSGDEKEQPFIPTGPPPSVKSEDDFNNGLLDLEEDLFDTGDTSEEQEEEAELLDLEDIFPETEEPAAGAPEAEAEAEADEEETEEKADTDSAPWSGEAETEEETVAESDDDEDPFDFLDMDDDEDDEEEDEDDFSREEYLEDEEEDEDDEEPEELSEEGDTINGIGLPADEAEEETAEEEIADEETTEADEEPAEEEIEMEAETEADVEPEAEEDSEEEAETETEEPRAGGIPLPDEDEPSPYPFDFEEETSAGDEGTDNSEEESEEEDDDDVVEFTPDFLKEQQKADVEEEDVEEPAAEAEAEDQEEFSPDFREADAGVEEEQEEAEQESEPETIVEEYLETEGTDESFEMPAEESVPEKKLALKNKYPQKKRSSGSGWWMVAIAALILLGLMSWILFPDFFNIQDQSTQLSQNRAQTQQAQPQQSVPAATEAADQAQDAAAGEAGQSQTPQDATTSASGTTPPAQAQTQTQPQRQAAGGASQSQPDEMVVQRGQTLWGIADNRYDNPYHWPWIYDANTASINNPNLIYAGQRLAIPVPQGADGSLTMSDSLQVALGYVETYRWYKENGLSGAKFYLYAARRYHSEVFEHTDIEIDEADLAFATRSRR